MGHCQLLHAFNARRIYTYHHQCS